MKKDYQVWGCQIVVRGDAKRPDGFDAPPRSAAIRAIEARGIEVVACFSGWGGKLTPEQRAIVEEQDSR